MAKKKARIWEPSLEDVLKVIFEQNPWQFNAGEVPSEWARSTERPLVECLWQRLKHNHPRRFQLVLGPRRVGKTTCMYQTVRRLIQSGVDPRQILWLRLDHPLLMRKSLGQLVELGITRFSAATNPLYLLLDELTYAADWDLWLKTFYDENWPVRLAGTSSATAAIQKRRQESGVGRWEEQYLAPYLLAEYLELIGDARQVPLGDSLQETLHACIQASPSLEGLADHRRRLLLTGGFPELLIESRRQVDEASALLQSQSILRSAAVERAIYKDIPQAFGVDNPLLLERLLYTLAGQTAGLLSPQSICKSLDGLSQPTFDRYLSYLERAFLVFALPNYSGSETSIQKRGRKLYFVDAAIRNAALQRGLAPLHDAAEMGMLLENMAATHLHALSQQSQVRVCHWREKDDEVDLVYDHPTAPMAFEIGMGASHHRKGLYAFCARYPKFRNRCYLVSPNLSPSLPKPEAMDDVGAIPLDLFLLAIGAQAGMELQKNLNVHP